MKRFILLLVLVTSCNRPQSCDYRPSTYEKDADKLTAQVAKKIQGETGLQLIGIGGGMMRQINCMAMSFACYEDLSLEKSRELLVYCVEEYLAAINADEKIRPHLQHFPFTSGDIEIRIFVFQKDRRDVFIGSLSLASQISGRVDFYIRQEGRPSLKKIHIESYKEAQKLAAEQLSRAQICQK